MAPKSMSRAVRARARFRFVLAAAVIQLWMTSADVARPQPETTDEPPPPIAAAPAAEGNIGYEPSLRIDGDDEDIRSIVESVSFLFELREEPLDAMGALFERARTDQGRIVRALNALGYFSARVAVTIDGNQPTDVGAEDRLAANPPAHSLKVEIMVERGPLFTLGAIAIVPAPGAAGEPLAALSPTALGLREGAPAQSSDVIAADAMIVAALREAGYPLAAVTGREAIADHQRAKLDVTFKVDAGPQATMGEVVVKGTERMNATFVAGLAPFAPGDPFRTSLLKEYTEEIERLLVFDAVAVEDAKSLTDEKRAPVTVTVHERPLRVVGVSASWSTLEGAALGAYWGHRNLFGEAEQLRIEGQSSRLLSNGADDYEYALATTLTMPAFPSRKDDLVIRLAAKRERPDAYDRDAIEFETRLRRRYDKSLTLEAGIAFAQARETDALGTRDRTIIAVPMLVAYDTRNNPLEPISGLRAVGEIRPFVDLAQSGAFATRFLGGVSAYRALDEAGETVVAGRVGIGLTLASSVVDLPTDLRFFAGGGGSVRGYPYQSISPRDALDQIIGGRSLVEGSVEVRHWLWDDIGVAAFADAGGSFTSNFPDFDEIGVGVGIGARYRTPVGPIRLDLAVPLDPHASDPTFAVYVALGQAF